MPLPIILTILRRQAAGPYMPLSFRAALLASLDDNAALTALVGTRIWAQMLPQRSALPALTYEVVSTSRVHNLAGASGLSEAMVSFKAFAEDEAVCVAIKEVLRNQFDGFNGGLPGSVITVGVFLKNEFDAYEEPVDSSDQGTYMIMNDYLFRYRESIPTF